MVLRKSLFISNVLQNMGLIQQDVSCHLIIGY